MKKQVLVLVGLVGLGVALQTTAEAANNLKLPPSNTATPAPTQTIMPKPALAIVTDTATAGIVTTQNGGQLLQGTWETMVKNQTSAVYPVYTDPGKWKLSITCTKADGSPSPKGGTAQDTFFGVQPGYSIGRVGVGKFMLHVDRTGMAEGECVKCTMKREITVGAKTYLSKSTPMPDLCVPAVPK